MANGNSADRRKQKREQQRLDFSGKEAVAEKGDGENKRGDLHNDEKEGPKKLLNWLREHFPTAAVWTALFTAVLTLFTYFQYRVSHATSEIQRNSERAFLTFSGPAVGARFTSGSLLGLNSPWVSQEIAINWGNNGETPARNVVIHLGANGFFPDIPTQFDYPAMSDKINAVIGPKSIYGTNIQVPRDSIIDAARSKKRLFVWGTATYDDVFEKSPKRLSEFCVELTHLTFVPVSQQAPDPKKTGVPAQTPPALDLDDPHVGLVAFQWQQCRSHNCYDTDCDDYKEITNPKPTS